MDETVMDVKNIQLEVSSLSYKFQRLRERLRQSIESGELAGKLPGERALAKQFHVNAKTLSKALTDLAAEGLLDRSIGRGTFVKGSEPAPVISKRWLALCDADQLNGDTLKMIREAHVDLEVVTDVSAIRPSFLNQFSAVIDLGKETPDAFIRDLVVRNLPVVLVGKEPKTYSTHAVIFDAPHAAMQLGRELLLGGHRKLAAIEPAKSTLLADALRQSASRYAAETSVEACAIHEIPTMIEHGVTAIICNSIELALAAKTQLESIGVAVPQQVSIAALGAVSTDQPISGFFLQRAEKIAAIAQLLTTPSPRPVTMYLAGKFHDHGTMAPLGNGSFQTLIPAVILSGNNDAAA